MSENSSSHPTQIRLSDHIVETIRVNENFLLDHAKDTIEEVVELINDAIDIVGHAVDRPENKKDYLERSMAFFIYHVLMPSSYAIYLDLIAANLPVCFIELRLLLESLVKCYLADLRHSDQSFFQERLKSLEQSERNISKLMRELGKDIGVGDEFVDLWSELSEDWVHTRGVASKVVTHVIERADIPPWALVVPMNFVQSDLDTLNELSKQISRFRSLLKISTEKYKQELGFSQT